MPLYGLWAVELMSVLVLQSCRNSDQPDWLLTCMETVRQWSRQHDFDYRLTGDEIFQRVPDWYREKVAAKLPVATDYGRLALMQEALQQEGFAQVIWFDADTYIYDQSLSLDFDGSSAFGQEVWVQKAANGSFRARRNVHNAVCCFRRSDAVLPFLMETTLSIIRRIDRDRIAPQIVGPKLLTALHNIACFNLLPQVGAFSPTLLTELLSGRHEALALLLEKSAAVPKAANLGASVLSPELAAQTVDFLSQITSLEEIYPLRR